MFDQEKLFELALNIEEPLYIKNIEFDEEQKELHIYIDFRKGSLFKCSICRNDVPVHDTEEKTWRHLNFFQHKAFLHFRTPRTKCPDDGVHFITPSWAGKGDFTLLMDAMIMQLAKYLPISQISSLLGEHDTKIWRIIKRYVNTAQAINDLSGVRKVGMDETASKRGHNYITLFVDMEKKAVIYATEGKGADTIREFKDELPLHRAYPNNIEEFSVDMSPSFISGINKSFPWAAVTFDRFHVVKMINEAIDKTRREEQKGILDLKSTRFIWLKNESNLTEKQKEKLDLLSQSNLKTGKAYRMKLALKEIYDTATDRIDAMTKLNQLYQWMVRSRIDPIKAFAKTLKSHWNGILNYFDTRLTNGILEGINSLVQAARTRAKGYRNISNFITMVYLIAGKLTFQFTPIMVAK